MKIRLSNSRLFNLDATLCCGQVFRWQKQGEWWYGAVKENAFKVRQVQEGLEFEHVGSGFLLRYFGLNDDLPKIYRQIGKDPIICRAIKEFPGLRIINQDPWECLISYICATYKNIPAIERMLTNLCTIFGKAISFEGKQFYSFPTLETLAQAIPSDLAKCGLGYRTKFVSETAKQILKTGTNFEQMKQEDYTTVKKKLLQLPGVGPKVADCVMLFSLEKSEAFPIDVWIRRTLLKYYSKHFPAEFVKKLATDNSLTRAEYDKLNSFGREYFGEYAGYAQEYMYHYERAKEPEEIVKG